jgi:ABC-type amino acid transport substrate-binding protein
MKTPDGQWTGLGIDLWRQIAAELNLQFEIREFALKRLLEGVTDSSLDAAVAALTITPEREKKFDFTHAFYTTGLGIAVAVKAQNPWFTVAKRVISAAFLKVLASLTLVLLGVGVLVWWFEHKKNPRQFNGSAARGIGSGFWWSAVTMTTDGKIQALVYDAPILRYYIHQNYIGTLEVLPYRLQRQEYGIALQSKSPLREQINVVLLQKIREKAWQARLSQYLGE